MVSSKKLFSVEEAANFMTNFENDEDLADLVVEYVRETLDDVPTLPSNDDIGSILDIDFTEG